MGIFNSTTWTGGDVADAVTLPKPAVKSNKLEPKAVHPTRDGYLAEYADLAQAIGVAPPDLGLEAFKDFLRKQDWGVFSLAEVIAYMDKKAAAEAKDKGGWQWRPLREKDHVLNANFGKEGVREWRNSTPTLTQPASDYYRGPAERDTPEQQWVTVPQQGQIVGLPVQMSTGVIATSNGYFASTGKMLRQVSPSPQSPYDKTIPLHALRKVAAIERDFKTAPVSFFVCDYAPLPEIRHPDPFLMAVINNPHLHIGVGRFIIDFWDEPGFGLDRMVK